MGNRIGRCLSAMCVALLLLGVAEADDLRCTTYSNGDRRCRTENGTTWKASAPDDKGQSTWRSSDGRRVKVTTDERGRIKARDSDGNRWQGTVDGERVRWRNQEFDRLEERPTSTGTRVRDQQWQEQRCRDGGKGSCRQLPPPLLEKSSTEEQD